jgi:hypothetical protein
VTTPARSPMRIRTSTHVKLALLCVPAYYEVLTS